MPEPSTPEGGFEWALVVHGGAKTIETEEQQAHRDGCIAAAQAGSAVLAGGGSAADAVEAAIRVLEDDDVFNAGFGSVLNLEGEVEMCSGLMEGTGLNVGAVAAVQGVRHPISIARAMLDEEPSLLAGTGARKFAADKGLELCPPEQMIAPDYAEGAADTVGCVALDRHGRIAAGTSTGGLDGQAKGRVGDSPLAGAGFYAEDGIGGVALSGDGERITRMSIAAHIMRGMEGGSAGPAAAAGIDRLKRIEGEAGAIVLDAQGRVGIAHNSDHFAVALVTSRMKAPRAGVHAAEVQDVIDHG